MTDRIKTYPAHWPKCPSCGGPAMDGHITCGRAACDETGERERAVERGRMAAQAAQTGDWATAELIGQRAVGCPQCGMIDGHFYDCPRAGAR